MKKDKRGTPFYDIVDPTTGEHICRVGYYHDPDLTNPEGMSRLLDYLPVFQQEQAEGKWNGFAFDSVSFASLSARKYHQYDLNPDTNNPLQWHGGATDLIEELLCIQLPGFACDVGAAFHVHRRKVDQEGEKMKSIRQPFVPGRRLEETKMVAAAWPELWRIYTKRDEKSGKMRRYLQTETNEKYQAGSTVGMPTDLYIPPKGLTNEWAWQGWTGKGIRPELHLALYADPHTGKSTLLSQILRVPFYVALMDGRGKDAAYRARGEAIERYKRPKGSKEAEAAE